MNSIKRKIFTHIRKRYFSGCVILAIFSVLSISCDFGGTFNGVDFSSISVSSVQNISLSATDYDFGSISLGNQTSFELTITNTGNIPLTVEDIALNGGGEFELDTSGGDNPLGGTNGDIPPGEERTLNITYIPSTSGLHTADLYIDSNDPDTPGITVSLTGDATTNPMPDIALSPGSHDFGNVESGAQSSPLEISVVNNGSADLNVSSIAFSGPSDFTLDLSGGQLPCGGSAPTLQAGDSCTVTVTFNPYSAGNYIGTLDVQSNDPDHGSISTNCSGTGVVTPPTTYSTTLSWNAPTSNADGSPINDLGGYKIYYGKVSHSYSHSVDVGTNTTYTIENLTAGTYYFSVTAYDTSGNESGYSNEVSKIFP